MIAVGRSAICSSAVASRKPKSTDRLCERMKRSGTGQSAFLEGLDEAAHPLAARPDIVAGGDDGDAAVAELDQVAGRLAQARGMLGQHRVDVERDVAVEQH